MSERGPSAVDLSRGHLSSCFAKPARLAHEVARGCAGHLSYCSMHRPPPLRVAPRQGREEERLSSCSTMPAYTLRPSVSKSAAFAVNG